MQQVIMPSNTILYIELTIPEIHIMYIPIRGFSLVKDSHKVVNNRLLILPHKIVSESTVSLLSQVIFSEMINK